MNSLDMKDIWKCYSLRNKDELTVLKGLNLQVRQGDMVAIMGPPEAVRQHCLISSAELTGQTRAAYGLKVSIYLI